MITDLPHITLGGGVFAITRFKNYQGSIHWRDHVLYKGYNIMRAYRIDNDKPCALYCFRLNDYTLIVRENLPGIKEEATRYSKARA